MREYLADLADWVCGGRPAALATVVSTFASAPLPVGSVMAVGPAGKVIGSVSGGCVEAAVYAECVDAMATGRPALVRYGVSDDDALEAGLTCGGTLEVLITRLDAERFPGLPEAADLVAADRSVVVATVLDDDPGPAGRRMVVAGDEGWGSLGDEELDAEFFTELPGLLSTGEHAIRSYRTGELRTRVFVQVFVPRPRMIVFGATDFAAALASAGSFVGYRVTVCDARPTFAAPHRFPDADEVVRAWPHEYLAAELDAERADERTAICVLTHDERFDLPLLKLALRAERLGYLGAMGSRRTHARRVAALRADGVDDDALTLLHSPLGLDLGAKSPQETAISIIGEIIAERTGRTGRRLGDLSGEIHSACVPSGGKSTSAPVARSLHSTPMTSAVAR